MKHFHQDDHRSSATHFIKDNKVYRIVTWARCIGGLMFKEGYPVPELEEGRPVWRGTTSNDHTVVGEDAWVYEDDPDLKLLFDAKKVNCIIEDLIECGSSGSNLDLDW